MLCYWESKRQPLSPEDVLPVGQFQVLGLKLQCFLTQETQEANKQHLAIWVTTRFFSVGAPVFVFTTEMIKH